MKILYVCPYYKTANIRGGPANSISSLCEGLAQAGTQITVFTTNANFESLPDDSLTKSVVIDGVPVWYFPLFYNGLYFFYSPLLTSAIKQNIKSYDLVVIDSLWSHPLIPAAQNCLKYQIPYIIPARGQLYPWALSQKKLKKSIYLILLVQRYIDRATAIQCTDQVEAQAVSRLGLDPQVFVVPNSIRCSNYNNLPKYGTFRRQFSIHQEAIVLLFSGRITQIKRPDIAVDTLAFVSSLGLGIDVHLIIAGPDQDGLIPQLKTKAQSLGCADKLHFTGLLESDAIRYALGEANLLLMPTEVQENFGMAALEALAAGVPVLVSEGVPVGRWAEEAGAGRIVTCKREAFQQAAMELLSTPEQLRKMGQNGIKLAREVFDIRVVTRQMLSQFEAIVATGRPLPETTCDLKPA